MAWHRLADLPEIYDVLWCRFPHRPDLHLPRDPPHPVLVRAIEKHEITGEAIIHVTYGTSKIKRLRRQWFDLIIADPKELSAAGLRMPTRFDLQDSLNKLPIDWNTDFFPSCRPIGRLNDACIIRLNDRLARDNRRNFWGIE